MGAVSQFISCLYTVTAIFFSVLLIEAVATIQFGTRGLWNFCKRSTLTRRYRALIEKKSSRFHYRRELTPELIECAVCLSKFKEGEEIRELQCKHTFHRDCLDRWLQYDLATCPICRSLVLPQQVVVEHRRLQSQQEYHRSYQELVLLLYAFRGGNLHGLLHSRLQSFHNMPIANGNFHEF